MKQITMKVTSFVTFVTEKDDIDIRTVVTKTDVYDPRVEIVETDVINKEIVTEVDL